MLKLLRNNPIYSAPFLLLYFIALKAPLFFSNLEFMPLAHSSLLGKLIFYTASATTTPNLILGLIIIFITALIINQIINRSNVCGKIGFIAAATYILLTSIFKEFNLGSPITLGNLLLVISLSQLQKLITGYNTEILLFNATFLVALASLIQPIFALFFVFVVLSYVQFSSIKFKGLLAVAMGIFTAYTVVLSILYLTNNWQATFGTSIFPEIGHYNLGWMNDYITLLSTVLVFILIALGVYYLLRNVNVQTAAVRRVTGNHMLFAFFGLASIVLTMHQQIHSLNILMLPLAILTTASFTKARFKTFAETLHLIVFALVILQNYWPLIV